MKAKMFKRVLAAMLAASSVMAMSGVAMAAKKAPGSEKSRGVSKNPAQSGKKVIKLKKIKARGRGKSKKYKKFKQKEGFMTTEKISNVLDEENMLSEECCNNAFVSKLTDEIESLKSQGKTLIFQDWPEEKKSELLDALIKWAKSDKVTVKYDIVRAISNLAEEVVWFRDRLKEKKSDLLGALVAACANSDLSVQRRAAWAFDCLTDKGVVDEYDNSDDALKLREILRTVGVEKTARAVPDPYSGDPILEYFNSRPHNTLVGMSPFGSMASMDIENNEKDDDEQSRFDCATKPFYFYTAMMGEEDMLSQDCCNDEFVLKITDQIRSLKHIHDIHYLKDCPKGKELELVNALISWAKADNITVKRNIAVAIGDLAQEGFFDDLPQEKKPAVLGALVNCADHDSSTKPDVAWAFKRLVDRRFVNENENSEEILKLKAILNECKDSGDVEPHLDVDDDFDSCEI